MRRCGSYFCEEPATWKAYIEGDDERTLHVCDAHRIALDTWTALFAEGDYKWMEIEMRGREPR